jgi:hypothetical protein
MTGASTGTFTEHQRRADVALAVHAAETCVGVAFVHDDGRPLAEAAIDEAWTLERTLAELQEARYLERADEEDEDDNAAG